MAKTQAKRIPENSVARVTDSSVVISAYLYIFTTSYSEDIFKLESYIETLQ